MIDVAIVTYEGMSLFHLSVPIAIFQDACPAENPLFRVRVCAEQRGKLTASGGLSIEVDSDIHFLERADVIIIPSWLPDRPPSEQLVNLLQSAHEQNKMIVGLCLGAYALAYSGLLDGKRATTHWRNGADFEHRFPTISCDVNPIFIAEDNLVTSAGSAAAIDCCLFLVKHFYGVKTANSIARVMVSSPERSGGQNQYIESPTIDRPSDERIAKLVDHIIENISQAYSLDQAADFCAMSTRNFSRQFKSANGISFTTWLTNLRLNYSLELLESTALSVTEVAQQAGFSSEQLFRKHFKLKYSTTPKAWRTLFQSATESQQ